ncbi:MAG TPA: toll/interleukin-1 receptor domain-containing protein [Chitinophagaceae bacterium]|nr:toll/interleukin-1 receptor domain-containing protein [Chitinophagaceae bacterium]
MTRHLKPEIYQNLLTTLARLFPGPAGQGFISPYIVVQNAQLDIARLPPNVNTYSLWDKILSLAEHEGKIPALLKEVQAFFRQDEVVNETIEKLERGDAYVSKPVIDPGKAGVIREGGKIRIFINYDKADKTYKDKLIDYLTPYINFPEPLPVVFFDLVDDIPAGADATQVIKQEIERADIMLLLLSNDFLVKNRGLCYNIMLTANELGKKLAPIIMRSAPVERIKLIARLQMLPRNGEQLALKDDAAYDAIAGEIFNVIQKLNQTTEK